jgi:hypothetical protein
MRDAAIKAGPVPSEVLGYWAQKGIAPAFSYLDVWGEEHHHAFSAAKLMRTDVLEAMRDELGMAIDRGIPFEQFARNIKPRMEALGWWAPHEVTDPKTGKTAKVDPPHRLKLIFETNMRTSRAVGQWERIQRNKATRPYLLYQLGPSERHRPLHVTWHGVLLPVDDPFWLTHFAPNGWNCRCNIRSVSASEANRLEDEGVILPEQEIGDDGLPTGHLIETRVPVQRVAPPSRLIPWQNKRTGRVDFVPEGIDPGFHHTPTVNRGLILGPAPVAPKTPSNDNTTTDETPTIPVPPKPGRLPKLPEWKPVDSQHVQDVVSALDNSDHGQLAYTASEIRETIRKRYRLPRSGHDIDKAEVYGHGHELYDQADAVIYESKTSRSAKLYMSRSAADPTRVIAHEVIHTMGGVVGPMYRGILKKYEEISTEMLAQHVAHGPKVKLQIFRPLNADKPLAERAGTFGDDGGATFEGGAYNKWRERVALAVAHVTNTWDGAKVQEHMTSASMVWRRRRYDDADEARAAFIEALRPQNDEQREFYRATIGTDWEGEP